MVEIRHAKINDWTTHLFSYSTVWARSSGVLAPWPSGNNSEGMQLWSGLVVVGEVVYKYALCMHAKSLQLCLTPYNPMDCSPQGSSVHGIFQARVLEWGAIAFSADEAWDPKYSCLFRLLCKLEGKDRVVSSKITEEFSRQIQLQRLAAFFRCLNKVCHNTKSSPS